MRKNAQLREGGKTNWEVPINASQNHSRLHGVQATQLQHDEEQEERSGQTGNEQVLPVLPQAHGSQRDEVRR